MPELPEVETIVRDLREVLPGRRFGTVTATHPKIVRFPSPERFCRLLSGRTVRAVTRRGKFIVCELDADDRLLVHLGMTGHITVVDPASPLVAHTHVRARLDDGREVRYDDARRFGRVLLGPMEVLERSGVLPRLGLEPLAEDFTVASFDAALRRTTRTVKAALLDQSVVAGLGNIYIDEACHLAHIRPTRRCHRLTRAQRLALLEAIRHVLAAAIVNRGSSIDDYRDVWNGRGRNQEVLRVYGRGGMPCLTCATPLRSTVAGGRTTVFCPACQR